MYIVNLNYDNCTEYEWYYCDIKELHGLVTCQIVAITNSAHGYKRNLCFKLVNIYMIIIIWLIHIHVYCVCFNNLFLLDTYLRFFYSQSIIPTFEFSQHFTFGTIKCPAKSFFDSAKLRPRF